MSTRHRVIDPEGMTKPATYAHVVQAAPGRMLFCAGQVSEDEQGNVVGAGDMRAQTTQVMRNLERVLAAAGASLDDVVRLVWYVTDLSKVDELRAVRNEVLAGRRVASTLVQVTSLYKPDLLVELEATAVAS